jgi:hypothetical protein
MLQQRAGDYEIELPVTTTPSGAVVPIEYALSGFEGERYSYRLRPADAGRRSASYRPRLGEVFVFEAALEFKLEQLADIENDLAESEKEDAKQVVQVLRKLSGGSCI